MKIAIFLQGGAFNRKNPMSPGTLSYSQTQLSAFRDTIRYFCTWTPAALDPNANILPQASAKYDWEEQARLFTKQIRYFDPDIIEVHGTIHYASYLARALPHIPVVFYSHDPHSRPREHNLNKFSRPAHIICVCHFAHQNFVAHYPEHKAKASVILNALPIEDWLAEDHGKEKIILFCGQILPGKGIQEFIQGIAKIRPALADWRIVVLGSKRASGLDFFQQQEMLFNKTLEDQGVWITNAARAQVQTWNKKAQIGVVPSNWDEVFPLTLLEMHMTGCAVISSGRGGMKEVSGPDGALYLKEVSGAAIAESLRLLINNPQERQALAQRGHQYVMRHHRIEDRVAQLDELRREIVAGFKPETQAPLWRERLRAFKRKMFG